MPVVRHASPGPLHGARRLIAAGLILGAIAACEPSAPPGFTGTPVPDGSAASSPATQRPSPVAGRPTVSLNGTTIEISGLGNGTSAEFELPAGSAQMTVSVCESNQVIPFVTLYDGDANRLGIIVEPVYEMRNLAGGRYSVEVATNPECLWTIVIEPA